MARVANSAFTNNPTVIGRVSQRLIARMVPPPDPDFYTELYDDNPH